MVFFFANPLFLREKMTTIRMESKGGLNKVTILLYSDINRGINVCGKSVALLQGVV